MTLAELKQLDRDIITPAQAAGPLGCDPHYIISPDTTWTESDIPTPEDMTLYLGCVGVLRGVLPLPDDTPKTPGTMENLTYVTANDIEKILETVDDVLTKSITFVWYSGDIYSGEVV